MTAFRMALSSLLYERGRAAVSIVGCAFAVVLIFMQLGFLGATRITATILYDELNFEVLLASRDYLDFSRAGTVERSVLAQAAAIDGVADVLPLSVDQGLWRNPTDDPENGKRRWAIVMLSFDPARLEQVFRPERVEAIFGPPAERATLAAGLAQTGAVLLDRKSKPYFGGTAMPDGTRTEYNGGRVELRGYFTVGTGFSYTGLLLANEETAGARNPRSAALVTFGLVALTPGQTADEVAARIRRQLPAERPVQVFTRAEIRRREQDHWLTKTPVGKFFWFGVGLALTVGAIFVYQMMMADIKKRLPEYATLKAVGYRFGYLFRVVVWQSLFLAFGGYALGLVVSLVLYEVTKSQLPVTMTGERLVGVLLLTTVMCVGSALLAVRKVRTADPADLF